MNREHPHECASFTPVLHLHVAESSVKQDPNFLISAQRSQHQEAPSGSDNNFGSLEENLDFAIANPKHTTTAVRNLWGEELSKQYKLMEVVKS